MRTSRPSLKADSLLPPKVIGGDLAGVWPGVAALALAGMVLWMAAQVRPPRAVSPTFVTTTSGGIIYLNTKNEPIPRVQQTVRVALSASRTLSLSEMKVEAVPDTALMDLLNRVDVHDYRPSVIDSPGPGYREQAGILPP